MTNQKNENGFTPIVNELFEKIYQSNFSLREIKIILAVIRYTDGFKRDSAELSLSFLSDAVKIHYSHVQTTVKNLIGKNVLVIESESRGIHSRKIRLNRNYELWNLSINQKSSISVTDSDNTSPDNKSNNSVTGSANSSINHKKGLIKPLIPAAIKGQISNLSNFHKKGFDIISTLDKSVHFQNAALCGTGLGTPFTLPDFDKYLVKQSKNEGFYKKDVNEIDEPGTEPGTACVQPANNTKNDNNEKEYSLNSDEFRRSSFFNELLKGRINPNHKTPDLQKSYKQNKLKVLLVFQKFKAIIYPRYKILNKVRLCT